MLSNVASTAESSKRLVLKPLKWIRMGLPVLLLVLGTSRIVTNFLSPANSSSSELLTQPIEQTTMPITITANGTIQAERSINLSPKTSGVIKTLLVEEGDRVRTGQLVAVMDDSNLQGQLTQMQGQLAQQDANLQQLIAGNRPEDIARAEAQLQESQANLKRLQSGSRPEEIAQATARLQQSQATLGQRELEWQRYQQLYDKGAVTRQELEQRRTDRDVAQKQLAESQQALALLNAGARPEEIAQAAAQVEQQKQTLALLKAGSRVEEIDQARAQVKAAQGSLQTIEAQLKDTKVIAPFNGVVIEQYADVGSFVSPSISGGSGASASSSSILMLASDRFEVAVNLSEAQIAQVEIGQTVTLKVDALPNKSFTGTVKNIAPQATVTQNVTSFEVVVAIASSSTDQLKSGMNVEAGFEVGHLENALLVPNAAVVRQAEGEGVYILGEGGKPMFQPIQTGITTDGHTEVKSGLQGTEDILLSPPSRQKDSGGFRLTPPRPPS